MKFISFLLFFALSQCAFSSRTVVPECNTPSLKNGKIRWKGTSGRIISYSCLTDFELVGYKYSTCIRGSWDTPTPICVSTKCPTRPPVPDHGMVYDQIKGALLMFFCDKGYTLIGDSQLYCDGKQWNGTAPYCQESECNNPRLKNGKIRWKGTSGRIIKYSCLTDFELVGKKYSTCIRGSWDTPTPICVSAKCPTRPPVPEHGMVYDQIKDAWLIFFCDRGYTLIGDSQLYCDGEQWIGTAPYCQDKSIPLGGSDRYTT